VRTGNLYRYHISDGKMFYRDNTDSILKSYVPEFAFRYDTTSRAVFSSCINAQSTRYITSENADMIKAQNPAFIIEYDISSGQELRRWNDSSNFVRYLADGHSFLTRSGVYSLDDGTLTRNLSFGNPEQAELLPNKNHVMLRGTDTSRISIFNIVNGNYTTHYYTPGKTPTSMALSADGYTLAVGTQDGSVFMFSVPGYALDDVEEGAAQFSSSIVHPNPAQNTITINSDRDAVIRIVDMCGREVLRTVCTAGSQSIDIQTLNNGVYGIECVQSTGIEYQRLVVCRE